MFKYNLFLDDVRQIYDVKWVKLPDDEKWRVARTYGEFVDTIEQLGLPEFISFDHDLADTHYKVGSLENESHKYGSNLDSLDYGPEKTGFDAARWLCNYCIARELPFPRYVVHSLNEVGGKRIDDYIKFCKEKVGML
jgi:hypothetical protein